MTLTRITKGVIKPNENYDTHNINSTGIVTAIGLDVNGNGDISGNLSVSGVLTYEDVTSIDSVGIITAQKDIHVGAGVSAVGVGSFGSLDISGDIDVDGHTNLDNVSVAGVTTATGNIIANGSIDLAGDLDVDGHTNLDNVSIAGVSTFSGNIYLPDNVTAVFGTDSDGSIKHTGSNFQIQETSGNIQIVNYANDKDVVIISDDGSGGTANYFVADGSTGKANLYYYGGLKLETNVTGVRFYGHSQPTVNNAYDLGASSLNWRTVYAKTGDFVELDVDGHTNLDNVSIAGVTTHQDDVAIRSSNPLILSNAANNASCQVLCDGGARLHLKSYNQTMATFENGQAIIFYTDSGQNRLQISNNGNVSIAKDLDVDGHTNLDNVSIAGVTTVSNKTQVNSIGIGIIPIDHHHIHIESANPRVLIRSTGTNAAKILFGDNSSNDPGVIEYSHSENSMRFNTANLERLRITGVGDLSLRTTTQNAYLGLTANSTAINTTLGSTAGTSPRLYLKGTGNGQSDAGDVFLGAGTGGIVNIRSAGLMKFEVNSDSSTLEALHITSSGQVLIGTTSPLSFNGAGGNHNLVVAGDSNDTDITDNYNAAITISNKDGTANNTAGLHFAREDTDGNPHYDGASVVAQFKETMNTGQYPKADLVFLTSSTNNAAPSEKFRITSSGNVGIATATPLYRVDIGDGVNDPASGYQFRINASGDYIFALAKQSTPSFSIRNNSTSVVHLNTQNSKRLALGVSTGSNSGSIEEHVNIIAGGSFIVGSSSYGAAGSFSVGATGTFRQVLAAGTAQDTLLNAISGVSNGFQLTTDASNNQTYKFHNGSTLTNIIKSNGYFGTGTSNPVAQFVVSKQNGEGVEYVPGSRTDENDIYHYDRGSNVYCSYRTYATKHEFWRAGTTQAVEVTTAGNLKLYGAAGLRMATQDESHTDYVSLQCDNHANTLLGMNLALNYTGASGTHQVKQVNAHGSIGSAGIFIGGNGSDNNSDITFFRNGQGSSAGTTFAQNSWKFRIGSELVTNYNVMQRMRGYFRTSTSAQTATNGPALAGAMGYAFGYQEAYSTSGGTWAHPYPDLVLGYHTGVSLGGYPNYGGCRFFTDHPSSSSTMIFSVGNGGNGVHVTNTLSKGGGSFRIAHPHPSKKYTHDLVHSFIEGPQMDLIYRGKIDLVDGSATVNIDTKSNMTDGTFVLLNRDVQCFTSNETGWTAVKGSVSGNILTITAQDNSCTDTISWMVVGERQDDKIKSLDMTDDNGDLITEPLTIEETHM